MTAVLDTPYEKQSASAIERLVRRVALSVNSPGARGYDVLPLPAILFFFQQSENRNSNLTLMGSRDHGTPLDFTGANKTIRRQHYIKLIPIKYLFKAPFPSLVCV